MKQTITEWDFIQAFVNYGRGEQFSRGGLIALFEYLEQYEEDTGETIELDVIALCCDYVQYDSFEELKEDYTDIEDMDDLEQSTQVIDIDGEAFIIQNF